MNKKPRSLSVLLLVCCALLLPGAARRHTVAIQQMTFSPAALNISVGDSVTWTNRDDREHAIVAEDNTFDSGKLTAGASFSHTFTKPGQHAYGCRFHPREKGSITVSN